jgi:hypothetical protein
LADHIRRLIEDLIFTARATASYGCGFGSPAFAPVNGVAERFIRTFGQDIPHDPGTQDRPLRVCSALQQDLARRPSWLQNARSSESSTTFDCQGKHRRATLGGLISAAGCLKTMPQHIGWLSIAQKPYR